MCGIAGIMTADGAPPATETLDIFARALAHRGPDGEGRHAAGGVAMVQRRLAIIDLETGDQPFSEAGGAVLIANGEIYNYVELAAILDAGQLKTGSDCEPPLHLYRRDGIGFARSLRGMYAIAIHDATADCLVLARDPFGIKPLYYSESPRGFAFASEPHALIEAGWASRKLHAPARAELLQLQFTTGRDTIYEDIKRVLPGETLVVSHGRVVERRILPALPEGPTETLDAETAIGRLDRELEASVRFHQRSDVPYGMFLSGGIDSSALLAMMARLNSRPVRAYTAGFAATDVADERSQARVIARAFGAEHIQIEIDEAAFWRLLPKIAAVVDDPCADYAIVPTFALAEAASRDVKVILCGEGGDELFGGYGRYRSAIRPWWRGGRAMRGRGIFDRLNVLREDWPGWRDGVVATETTMALPGRTRLQVVQAVDCADWLPNDLLTKLDRCLMAHGVEGRTPFLDVPLAMALFPLPDALKVRGRLGKWLLRQWLADHAPMAQPFARKQGFTVPVIEWISRHGATLGELVAAQPGIIEICRPEAVRDLFKKGGKHAGFASWTLLFYALWHRANALGFAPQGDVFETLSNNQR